MLPLYKRTMRFMSDPYVRMKKHAIIGSIVGLLLLYVFLVGLAPSPDSNIIDKSLTPSAAQPAENQWPIAPPSTRKATDPTVNGERKISQPNLREEPMAEAPQKDKQVEVQAEQEDGAMHGQEEEEKEENPKHTTTKDGGADEAQTPLLARLFLPLVAGFSFGFLGSVPIAGPTSAMVLKLGIQGKYHAGLTIAFGGALSEATYAGIAFWGFGSFLAGAKFLLPVSKVLGAIMFTLVGLVFLRSDMKPSLDPEKDASKGNKGMGRAREEVVKNVLMGVTMSGINPALLATYTGAIASSTDAFYGTGMLEFTLFLAFVFAIGVCCGVSTWFYLLLSLLKKYKQRLKDQTIGKIMRFMGCFLLTLGVLCAKSSIEYFFWGVPEGK